MQVYMLSLISFNLPINYNFLLESRRKNALDFMQVGQNTILQHFLLSFTYDIQYPNYTFTKLSQLLNL